MLRVAVIGPGLNFIDKDEASAFDYYPLQSLQPFALLDSLLQLSLARAAALTVFDISARLCWNTSSARYRRLRRLSLAMISTS